jgi:hypothetical protein
MPESFVNILKEGLSALHQLTEEETDARAISITSFIRRFGPFFLAASSLEDALERLRKKGRVNQQPAFTDLETLIKEARINQKQVINYLFSLPATSTSSYEPSLEESKRGMFDNSRTNKKEINYL